MEITFLGSGTSHGIPVLTCKCSICLSNKPENKRLRSSIFIKTKHCNIVVDTTPEFRIQALRESINNIDAVFYTHTHADHLHGIDDIRPYSTTKSIPLYGRPEDLTEIESRFPYIFKTTPQLGGGKPNLKIVNITNTIKFKDLQITPIPIKHGVLDIYGYRFNNVAYLTDCSYIPKSSLKLLNNLDTLIVGALRYKQHKTHFSIDEAIEAIRLINPKNAYITHICHDVEHFELINYLEEKGKKEEFIKKIKPAFDGLCLNNL